MEHQPNIEACRILFVRAMLKYVADTCFFAKTLVLPLLAYHAVDRHDIGVRNEQKGVLLQETRVETDLLLDEIVNDRVLTMIIVWTKLGSLYSDLGLLV